LQLVPQRTHFPRLLRHQPSAGRWSVVAALAGAALAVRIRTTES